MAARLAKTEEKVKALAQEVLEKVLPSFLFSFLSHFLSLSLSLFVYSCLLYLHVHKFFPSTLAYYTNKYYCLKWYGAACECRVCTCVCKCMPCCTIFCPPLPFLSVTFTLFLLFFASTTKTISVSPPLILSPSKDQQIATLTARLSQAAGLESQLERVKAENSAHIKKVGQSGPSVS